jgi:hypothetical protein
MVENKQKKRTEIPLLVSILISLFVIWALTHTVRTRPIEDVIKYSSYIIAVASIIFISIFIAFAIQSGISKPTKADLLVYFGIVVMIIIIGPIYYSIGASLKDLYFWIQSPELSKRGAIILTLIITLILGLTLFYFRLRARSIYGITEAAVGLTVAANKISLEDSHTVISSNFYLAMLTASVYLVVRGLDNIHQGLTKEPIDPYILKVLVLFRRKKEAKNKDNSSI